MPLRNRRLEMGNKPVKGVADAVDPKDAINKGQVDASIAAITTTSLGAVPTSRTISAGTGLTGGGDLSANRTLTLADTAVTPATYTLATVTVDQQGRITSAANGSATETWTTAFKTSSQSVTSSTTFTNVTSLTFSVTSGTYAFEFQFPATAGAGGIKTAVNGPTLTNLYVVAGTSADAITAYDTIITSTLSAASFVYHIYGVVTVSASGTFALRFAQASSSGAATTIQAGGFVRWARMP